MNVLNTSIPGVKIIEPDYHRDGRGYFVGTYNAERYKAAGITADFVHDNKLFDEGCRPLLKDIESYSC